ncbi:MAG TPA: alpha/beta fold hydrolase [Steroidobacteraceae bacterium]|nr:alpha/beta fold hydrolase [Steroidobacteraceae bacterium]
MNDDPLGRSTPGAPRPAPAANDSELGERATRTPTAASSPSAASSPPPPSDELDKVLRSQLATVTGGLAPEPYVNAWWDWYLNLAAEPGKQAEIVQDALAKGLDSLSFALRASTGQPLSPAPEDARYRAAGWQQFPFNVYAHAYENLSDWWRTAWSRVPGVAPKNEQMLEFLARNALETVSPSNYLATNPELLETTRAEGGANLVRGFQNWLEDVQHTIEGPGQDAPTATASFLVGRDVAVTPGQVILRNELCELIQYSPATETVYAEPVLIVPAWIMKYYILDLSPANSMVRYLVSQGHTVFVVSWKNPGASESHLGMDDYLKLGIRDTLDAVSRVVPGRAVHAVGYCIGGTLLSIAAAALAAEGDTRLASVTLLAAQQDFSEPGELSVFISPSQLDMLETVMQRAGVLKAEQMGGAFALLRSRDLLWTPAINNYVRGRRDSQNDLMAWNADGTRMPYRMHAEYLRKLYLNNELARGEFEAEGRRVDLSAIRIPMFVVGTETDHVAPWRSVYKARGLTRSSDYTFLLTSGGHNAGIVSGPQHPRRRHRMHTWLNSSDAPGPDAWLESTPPEPGSWWPLWERWLAQHSSPERVPPPPMGSSTDRPLAAAPGEYVLKR